MPETPKFETIDLARPPASLSNRLPDLTVAYERLFRAFRTRLFQDIRRNIEICNGVHRIVQHDDLLNSIQDGSVLFAVVEIAPLRGLSIIMIEGVLLSAIVDDLFGAAGLGEQERRFDLTPMERRIGESLIRMVGRSIDDALRPHFDVEVKIIRTETHPTLASVADAAEPYYGMIGDIALGGGTGRLSVGFPYRSLEVFRTALSSPGGAASRQGSDAKWDRHFTAALDEIEITLGVEVAIASVPLKMFGILKQGDVLPLSFHKRARIIDSGAIVAEASYGRLDDENYGVIFSHAK